MAVVDKIMDEIIQYDINRKAVEIPHCQQVKLINMNFLQTKKYCHLIKVE